MFGKSNLFLVKRQGGIGVRMWSHFCYIFCRIAQLVLASCHSKDVEETLMPWSGPQRMKA